MSRSETTTHCLIAASIGASAVATNFFTNFETSLALGSAAIAAGLFVFGFTSLLVNHKAIRGDLDERMNDEKMDSVWRHFAKLEEDIVDAEQRCIVAIDASDEKTNRSIGQVYLDLAPKD